jgi:hypothetical protein
MYQDPDREIKFKIENHGWPGEPTACRVLICETDSGKGVPLAYFHWQTSNAHIQAEFAKAIVKLLESI